MSSRAGGARKNFRGASDTFIRDNRIVRQQGGNCVADCLDGGNETDILEAYNSEREMEWRALMGLSKHFSVRDETDSFLENNVDKLFGSIPASINSLPQIAESFGMDLISV